MIEGSRSGSGYRSIPPDWWIRIRIPEAQKHVDPVDPDPYSDSDPQHWLNVFPKQHYWHIHHNDIHHFTNFIMAKERFLEKTEVRFDCSRNSDVAFDTSIPLSSIPLQHMKKINRTQYLFLLQYLMLRAIFDRYTLTPTAGDDILHTDLSSLAFFFRTFAPIDDILH